MLGRAPIVDFDGTLARLDVDWDRLRRELGITRIGELWSAGRPGAWEQVAAAEVAAAAEADAVVEVIDALDRAERFAVLSSNAESAIWRFLARFPHLEARAACVAGRETLGGPKDDFTVFARGFDACVRATSTARGHGAVEYIGDMPYEIEFARRLGAVAIAVDDLARPT